MHQKLLAAVAGFIVLVNPARAELFKETSADLPGNENSQVLCWEKDFSHKTDYKNGAHQIQCFGGAGGVQYQTHRRVDPILATSILRSIEDGKYKVKNKNRISAYVVENKKLVQKKFFTCDVFKPAIAAAKSSSPFKKANLKTHDCDKGLNTGSTFDDMADLKHKISFFDNQPDTRQTPTEKEMKEEYSAIGGFLHRSAYETNNKDSISKLGLKKYLKTHQLSMASGFFVKCPDGITDVLITNKHTFKRESDGKSRSMWIKEGTDWAKKGCLKKKDGHCLRRPPPKEYVFTQGRKLTGNNYVRSLRSNDIVLGHQGPTKISDAPKDWAVIRINKPAPNHVRPLKISSKKLQVGSCLKVVGWLHENKIKKPDLKKQTCQLKGYKYDGILKHNCQTSSASSGSPILDCETNEVVAIHQGYLKTKNFAEREFKLEEGSSNGFHYNVGVPFFNNQKLKEAIKTQCEKG